MFVRVRVWLPHSFHASVIAAAAATMILSSYRNPPYRTPTPKAKSNSPPPTGASSPKRKRTDSQIAVAGPSLQINTLDAAATIPETPTDSPQTKVVEGLRDLDISKQPQVDHGAYRGDEGSPRKRLKRNPHLKAPEIIYDVDLPPDGENQSRVIPDSQDAESQSRVIPDSQDAERQSRVIPDSQDAYSASESSSQPTSHGKDVSSIEIEETPDWRRTRFTSPPPPQANMTQQPIGAVDVIMDDASDHIEAGGFYSPPSTHFFTPPKAGSIADSTTSDSPAYSDEADAMDRISMTWQMNEITGQDIDITSPDDDGEGINGIGFKPTAAMAYARNQRRKQQVNEWKAREAREARQRRIEKRRGAAAAEARAGQSSKRSVRFEGFG
ncbi:hypothetical protein LTR15_009540 [Elasticomyces elasticus]|nr:hypothetical protein LTR15_009540 [Elasticomyces elasticus]